MNNYIQAENVIYGNFFRKASEIHLIPALQRPYTWDLKNTQKLLEDIMENDEGYYIGNIVMVASQGSISRDEVIDGQQRLITLSLFLMAIRSRIKKNEKIKNEIFDMLVKYRPTPPSENRLEFTNKKSNDVFLALVNEDESPPIFSEVQARFVNNFEEIKKIFTKFTENQVLEIFNKICNLQIIFIKCPNKSMAYKLFESINSTGVNLVSTDMIKNDIFRILEGDKKQQDIEKKWEEMYQLFNEKSSILKTYIRHHWISTVGYTSHSKLFDEFQEQNDTQEKIIKYTDSLFYSAEIYANLRDVQIERMEKFPRKRYEKLEIKETLEFLKYLNVDQVYSALLYLYRDDPSNFKKDLNRFVAFQFLYKYIPGSPSVTEKIFANYCKSKKNREKTFKELYEICESERDNFKKKFIEKAKYKESKSGDIQYVLENYLYYLGGANKFKKATIEHIIAKSLGNDDIKRFEDKKRAKELIHSIGNLTILEEDENGSLQDKPYSQKENFYKKSIWKGNKKIVNYSFSEDPQKAITRRAEDIASDVFDSFLKILKEGKWTRKNQN